MKPKRILFVEANLDGTIGGSYYCLLEIVKGLDRKRYEPIVGFYTDNPLIPEFKKYCETTIITKRRGLVIAKDMPVVYSILRKTPFLHHLAMLLQRTYNFCRFTSTFFLHVIGILLRHRVDLVHLNNTPSETAWLIACKLLGLKCIAHLRSNWEPKLLEKRLLRFYDAIISISDSVAGYVAARNGYTGNFITIHDGIDVEGVFKQRRKEPYELRNELDPAGNGRFLVGAIGNIKDWKGQHVVIEAMDILKRKHEDIKCLIIGDISKLEGDRKYLESLKSMVEEKNLGSYVHLTGFRKDIPDIVSALDVLLLPSIAPEPFGRVILEAMIFSKPVIATAHGGPLDIIEDNLSGFLVKPNDPKALADKIEYLKNHIDIIKAVGECARRRVEECFAIGKNVKKIEMLYSGLL